MKRIVAILLGISMLFMSITGVAVSVNNSVKLITGSLNDNLTVNKATESPEINNIFLSNINQEVNKYLNFEKYNIVEKPRTEPRNIQYPWDNTLLRGEDFVQWIIKVKYEDRELIQVIDINPTNLKDKFLDHPWHYEFCSFDTNGDGADDLKTYYSIFNSQLTNYPEGIDTKSIRTCLKVDTSQMIDRDGSLEIWSQLKLNYGLIKEKSRSYDRSNLLFGKTTDRIIENIKEKFDNSKFPFIKNLFNIFLNTFNKNNEQSDKFQLTANDYDWIAIGIGMVTPEKGKIPIYFEKRLNVAKDNIFSPVMFEQELHQITSRAPLGLLFGFQSYKEGSQNPSIDASFEIDFDPCISVKTQFIPRNGYIYYYYDTESGNSQETRVTFTTNGIGINDVELTLIFDNTNPLVGTNNWMSFDVEGLGFTYKANKKHNVGILLTAPSFSTKLKVNGLPTSISCGFDIDFSFTYQQGHLLDAEATGSLNLNMNSNLDSVILYYPELNSNEPKIEFVKVTNYPASQKLSANAHIMIQNGSMTTLLGEGYVGLSSSGNIGNVNVFYRKADPNDPDKLFIDIPQGIPGYNRVDAMAKLYIDLNNFQNPDNYVDASIGRSSSGDITEIDGYLPGETEPIVKLTRIPANSIGQGHLEWNRLKGNVYASRSGQQLDPIELNINIGTFDIYNYFQIGDGSISLAAYLAQNGYFDFYTTNNMLANNFKITDTSTGNQLKISAGNVDADVNAAWDLDLSSQPIQINELAFDGEISLLKDFEIDVVYQGKNMNFLMNWQMGQEGIFSLDFTQNDPIKLIFDDLFQNNPTFDLGGGVIISEDFHFDVKWKWQEGGPEDPGYFKINEDTNNPNFDWIGFDFTYTPSGYTTPQYGVQIGGNNVGLIVYCKWWKIEGNILPHVAWYVYIMGDFFTNLLWNGQWYLHVEDW